MEDWSAIEETLFLNLHSRYEGIDKDWNEDAFTQNKQENQMVKWQLYYTKTSTKRRKKLSSADYVPKPSVYFPL